MKLLTTISDPCGTGQRPLISSQREAVPMNSHVCRDSKLQTSGKNAPCREVRRGRQRIHDKAIGCAPSSPPQADPTADER